MIQVFLLIEETLPFLFWDKTEIEKEY